MSYTTHWNLPNMPTGAVDWPAVINDAIAKLEAGRTLKLTANATLVKGDGFYIGSNGQAYKATDTTLFLGIWLGNPGDTTTETGTEGYGQVGGYIVTGTGWTVGAPVFIASDGTLTQTQPDTNPPPVGVALTSTSVLVYPQLGIQKETRPLSMLFGEVTHELTADTNYTLTDVQNRVGFINITDATPNLTTTRDIIFSNTKRRFWFINSTAQTLVCKVTGQTGVSVAAETEGWLRCDGTDIFKLSSDW